MAGGLGGALEAPGLEADRASGLPLLHGKPDARATLYLDFTGNYEASWSLIPRHTHTSVTPGGSSYPTFTDVHTPAFDMDGRPESFNRSEQEMIRDIWARVVEDYAPFDINVTTSYYGGFENRVALRVAIGGSYDDWFGPQSTGVASVGSFADSAPNVVFVFAETIQDKVKAGQRDGHGVPLALAATVATTISHEAGHAFGLEHHRSVRDGEYDTGSRERSPIMGSNLEQGRTTWGIGDTDIHSSFEPEQDDMAVITSAANGIRYRKDDHSNTPARATGLGTLSGTAIEVSGIIEKRDDVDVFSFVTAGGALDIRVDVARLGPNLDARVELWFGERMLAFADPAGRLGAVLNTYVFAGAYTVRVRGHGDAGDVGQYTLSVSSTLPSLLKPDLRELLPRLARLPLDLPFVAWFRQITAASFDPPADTSRPKLKFAPVGLPSAAIATPARDRVFAQGFDQLVIITDFWSALSV